MNDPLNEKDHLSNYARAHLRLTEIDRRFEAVMDRYKKQSPIRWRDRMSWQARLARSEARHQARMFARDDELFNLLIHGKP